MAKKVKLNAYEHSALTDDLEHCFLCGKPSTQFHHVFGASNRNNATDDDMFIPVCWNCHINKIHNEPSQRTDYGLKQFAQAVFEETHTREEFMKRYGKNYL